MPHTEHIDHPRFPGDIPRSQCSWLPDISETILKRLWQESHEDSPPAVLSPEDLPPPIKKRREANAGLRKGRSEKRDEAEQRAKWRPVDDYEPVRPWLGPVGAEFLKVAEELPDYAAPVTFPRWTL